MVLMQHYLEGMRMNNKRSLKRSFATAVLCIVAAISLQGCVEMLIGTAVMGTFAAVKDACINPPDDSGGTDEYAAH